MAQIEKRISRSTVYEGEAVNLYVDEVELPDGSHFKRELVDHPGGAGVAMEDEEGRFFLVTQFRYGENQVTLEYPAGHREAGEDPLVTAQREIREETGWSGRDFQYLGRIAPTPAYDNEIIWFYYCRKDQFVGQHLDADEYLNVSRLSLEEIRDKILSGEIDDAKTVAMTFLLLEKKKKGQLE